MIQYHMTTRSKGDEVDQVRHAAHGSSYQDQPRPAPATRVRQRADRQIGSAALASGGVPIDGSGGVSQPTRCLRTLEQNHMSLVPKVPVGAADIDPAVGDIGAGRRTSAV
jgi:hypothetical protein